MSLAAANRDVYNLLKNGVKVDIRTPEGELMPERIRVIDWDNPANNHCLLVSQLWVTGEVRAQKVADSCCYRAEAVQGALVCR